MEHISTILSVLGAAIVAFFVGRAVTQKKRKMEDDGPAPNRSADAANDTIQQTFQEEVSGVWERLKGKDPAGDLADTGNSRNRR